MVFYAVAFGKKIGIFEKYSDCKESVGFKMSLRVEYLV